MPLPILYSFRRCPYAIRARMALRIACIDVEHREVVLSRKPASLFRASAKGEVPVLLLTDGRVLDQSVDIMRWALHIADPEGWLPVANAVADSDGADALLIAQNDSEFKHHLDRTKYPTRYPNEDPLEHRRQAEAILMQWERGLEGTYFLGERFGIVDAALGPFVRQFRGIDEERFGQLPLPRLRRWLEAFLSDSRFTDVMTKNSEWSDP